MSRDQKYTFSASYFGKAYSLAGRYAPSERMCDSNASMPKVTSAGG